MLLVDVVDKCSPNYLTVIEITEPALIDKAAKLWEVACGYFVDKCDDANGD